MLLSAVYSTERIKNMSTETIIKYAARILTFLLVTPLHESAHGWMAKQLGDDTAERNGRITLNPFAHLDPLGTVLIILTGFGWANPVPVNPLLFKKVKKNGKRVTLRGGMALTALAGPVSNLIAAFVVGLAYNILLCTETGKMSIIMGAPYNPTMYTVQLLLSYLFSVNVGLAVFNLIPFPPLDGFHILSFFTKDKFDRFIRENGQLIIRAFFGFMLLSSFVPQLTYPLRAVTGLVTSLLWMTVSWIPVVFS
jgi:Zn-dependent protease